MADFTTELNDGEKYVLRVALRAYLANANKPTTDGETHLWFGDAERMVAKELMLVLSR